jgi:ribonuclease HII
MIETALLESGITSIAGVDEAGRGACAGPLVVAAVILQDPRSPSLHEVRDSKALTSRKREKLFDLIISESASYSIITIQADEIDRIGLHVANLEGMRRAVAGLSIQPQYVLTDGYQIEGLSVPNLAVWKGDQVAITISAASIVAKVSRDRMLRELDLHYPGYGLAGHKGYVTSLHQEAIERLGVLPIHRKSYANIASLINTK